MRPRPSRIVAVLSTIVCAGHAPASSENRVRSFWMRILCGSVPQPAGVSVLRQHPDAWSEKPLALGVPTEAIHPAHRLYIEHLRNPRRRIMKTIGKYQETDEIGPSPAGVTCRVRDPFKNREFALKILSPLAALSAVAKDQLYRDLATSWELSHRHIAKVQDVGELEGGVCIATDLLVGSSLSHFLATQTPGIGE